jgi:hypothetical protein
MNYEQTAARASATLAKKGRDVILRQMAAAGTYDTDQGSVSAAAPTDSTLKGVLFDFASGQTTVRGTLIEAGDKELYLEAKAGVVPSQRDQILVGADTYKVVSMGEINPAGVPVLYQLHLRR